MPNSDTFDIAPIGRFVKKYLSNSRVSVDPYSRNKRWATYTNDLNPSTTAELVGEGVIADLVIIDPPYSPRQVKECYDCIGLKMKQTDALRGMVMSRRSEQINLLMPNGGVVLTFGWNTNGMGKKHGYEIEEILLVAHGSDHNDTICMAERRG